MRSAAAVIAGIVVGVAVIALIELLGHQLMPVASDIALRNPESGDPFAGVPLAAKLIVVFAWFAGALVGGIVARRIARVGWTAWLVAAVIAAGGIATIFMIPHPFWMQLAAVLAPVLGALAANHLLPTGERPAGHDGD